MEKIVLTTNISDPDVSEAIGHIIRKELKEFFDSQAKNSQKEFLSNFVVDLNGLIKARPFIGSRSTLYKKVSKGLIPHSKQGKKLYFDLNEIDEWLLKYKVKPIDKLHQEYTRRKK